MKSIVKTCYPTPPLRNESRFRYLLPLRPLYPVILVLAGGALLPSCVSLKTEHKVEPIHITMDINVRLERELESAFSDLDARAKEIAENREKESDPQ